MAEAGVGFTGLHLSRACGKQAGGRGLRYGAILCGQDGKQGCRALVLNSDQRSPFSFQSAEVSDMAPPGTWWYLPNAGLISTARAKRVQGQEDVRVLVLML